MMHSWAEAGQAIPDQVVDKIASAGGKEIAVHANVAK
jgi:hypothetical protein